MNQPETTEFGICDAIHAAVDVLPKKLPQFPPKKRRSKKNKKRKNKLKRTRRLMGNACEMNERRRLCGSKCAAVTAAAAVGAGFLLGNVNQETARELAAPFCPPPSRSSLTPTTTPTHGPRGVIPYMNQPEKAEFGICDAFHAAVDMLPNKKPQSAPRKRLSDKRSKKNKKRKNKKKKRTRRLMQRLARA